MNVGTGDKMNDREKKIMTLEIEIAYRRGYMQGALIASKVSEDVLSDFRYRSTLGTMPPCDQRKTVKPNFCKKKEKLSEMPNKHRWSCYGNEVIEYFNLKDDMLK